MPRLQGRQGIGELRYFVPPAQAWREERERESASKELGRALQAERHEEYKASETLGLLSVRDDCNSTERPVKNK